MGYRSQRLSRQIRSAVPDHYRAHTFSICAVDPDTGEAGVAVASKCLAVGGLVPYAEPGVGAIATQATVNPLYGIKGLELLRNGLPAPTVVENLVQQDVTITAPDPKIIELYKDDQLTEEGVDFSLDKKDNLITWQTSRIRQLGVVDAQGNAATHSGARTFAWSGSATGKGYCCQGNLLAGAQVISAMQEAFEKEREHGSSLVTQLFAALKAGNQAGGDKRGQQAAAILVVRKKGHWSGSDRYCDLRVDDHAAPIAELERILVKNHKLFKFDLHPCTFL